MNLFRPMLGLLIGTAIPALLLAQNNQQKVEVIVAAHQYEFYGDVVKVLKVLEKQSIKDFKLVEAKNEGIFVTIIAHEDPKDSKIKTLAEAIGELKVKVDIRGPIEQWAAFSKERLDKLGAKKTIVIVVADWCSACIRMEKSLQDPKIAKMIKKHNLQMLRLDATDVKDEELKAFLDTNKAQAVPTLIMYAKGANKKPESFTCPMEAAKIIEEIEKRIAKQE